MVGGRVWFVALLAVLCSGQCQRATLSVQVTSQQNITGHWISQVEVGHGTGGLDTRKWSLNVTYVTEKCQAAQTERRIVFTVTAPPERVGPDYTLYPGLGHYKFHPVATTWPLAGQVCEREGAHLAVIDSLPELEKMQEMFARFPPNTNIGSSDGNHAWVGFDDLAEEGRYITIFGEPFNKSLALRWTAGNPDSRADSLEDCGGIHRNIPGGVIDYHCNNKLAFICEQQVW